ncbi:MAG: serine hydrolase domain-containing protein [Planctomycetota bacterium]
MNPLPRVVLLALALSILPLGRATAEDADDLTPGETVDHLVAAAGVRGDGPGVAVLVMDASGVRFKKCYGLANMATLAPITSATTFELASVSKHFTGAAALLLLQQGKIRLGDDVRAYLPELPAYDPEHPITIDHLSRHLSGLPDYLAWEDEPSVKKAWYGNHDALLEFARRRESAPLVSVPGETYAYSNSGYLVLALVVERVTKGSMGAFLQKAFFTPFGMKTAWVHESPRVPTAAAAIGYTLTEGEWHATWSPPTPHRHEARLMVGDGGVWASLDDLAAWDRGLRAGKYLRIETLVGALAAGRTTRGERIPYAMGWELGYDDDGDVETLSHSGRWDGFETFFGHHIESELTVVILSNRRGLEASELAEAVGTVFGP